MTILYNMHTDGDEYRCTKFNDGEVESSYLCSTTECQCPAGSRQTCRHRQMLPMFLNRGAVDTFWFLDWDRKGWVSNAPPGLDGLLSIFENAGEAVNSERSELSSNTDLILNEIERDIVESIPQEFRPHSPTVTTTDFESVDDSSILSVAAKPSWRRL